ncbi:hypothetical protein PFFVO_03307 [Plasmodium falciparum Vietnam Oak-Knoll (FVO)]|uniref:Uncharacterized protein n=1 Tax=Plasmodium falciparum Vietnam Oak-Knoll (FVO) TaxID=1036723 RepID=A0A024V5H9_PLAFA|nr:hypothetical protein PFFVO_03307 [Plasmodium falciparum Vietnam Oak-Knoll (FVO)]
MLQNEYFVLSLAKKFSKKTNKMMLIYPKNNIIKFYLHNKIGYVNKKNGTSNNLIKNIFFLFVII